jgi:hypothetical protein
VQSIYLVYVARMEVVWNWMWRPWLILCSAIADLSRCSSIVTVMKTSNLTIYNGFIKTFKCFKQIPSTCACMCACPHTHTHTHTHTHAHTRTHTCARTRRRVCVHMHTCIHAHIHTLHTYIMSNFTKILSECYDTGNHPKLLHLMCLQLVITFHTSICAVEVAVT